MAHCCNEGPLPRMQRYMSFETLCRYLHSQPTKRSKGNGKQPQTDPMPHNSNVEMAHLEQKMHCQRVNTYMGLPKN